MNMFPARGSGRDDPGKSDADFLSKNYSKLGSVMFRMLNARLSRDFRAAAIARLGLEAGNYVVDLGCGPGLSFPVLSEQVGPTGRVLGIEASAEMANRARERIKSAGLVNVTVIESLAQDWTPEQSVDAILACGVNQLIRSPELMDHIVAWLVPGGRFVAAGSRRGSGVSGALHSARLRVLVPLIQKETSALQWILHDRPWQEMERQFPNVDVEYYNGDATFVAVGSRDKEPGQGQ